MSKWSSSFNCFVAQFINTWTAQYQRTSQCLSDSRETRVSSSHKTQNWHKYTKRPIEIQIFIFAVYKQSRANVHSRNRESSCNILTINLSIQPPEFYVIKICNAPRPPFKKQRSTGFLQSASPFSLAILQYQNSTVVVHLKGNRTRTCSLATLIVSNKNVATRNERKLKT